MSRCLHHYNPLYDKSLLPHNDNSKPTNFVRLLFCKNNNDSSRFNLRSCNPPSHSRYTKRSRPARCGTQSSNIKTNALPSSQKLGKRTDLKKILILGAGPILGKVTVYDGAKFATYIGKGLEMIQNMSLCMLVAHQRKLVAAESEANTPNMLADDLASISAPGHDRDLSSFGQPNPGHLNSLQLDVVHKLGIIRKNSLPLVSKITAFTAENHSLLLAIFQKRLPAHHFTAVACAILPARFISFTKNFQS